MIEAFFLIPYQTNLSGKCLLLSLFLTIEITILLARILRFLYLYYCSNEHFFVKVVTGLARGSEVNVLYIYLFCIFGTIDL